METEEVFLWTRDVSVDVLKKKEKEKTKPIYRPTSFRSPWMFYVTREVLLLSFFFGYRGIIVFDNALLLE